MFRKKIVFAVAILIAVALCGMCFVACDKGGNTGEKNITVYVGEKEFEVVTTEAYLDGVLWELYEDGKLTAYTTSGSAYGEYITQIDVLTLSGEKYYTVWHSVDKFELKCVYDNWAPSRSFARTEDGTAFAVTKYKNTTLYYSGVGISSLPIVDGGVYAVLID